MDILFENVTAVTMDDAAQVLTGAYIGVEDGKITYMGHTPPEDPVGKTIDGTGKVLMPGLVNSHTHLPMTLLRGYADGYDLQTWLEEYIFPAEDRLDGRAVKCAALLGIAEALSFGTTSVSDMYSFCDEILQAVELSGIKANISRGTTQFTEDFDFETNPACMELQAIHQKWHNRDKGRIKIEVSIHAEYTSNYLLWEALSEYAINNNLGMHVHLSETKSEHESCLEKYGLTPAQLLDCHRVWDTRAIAAHCVHVTDEDISLLARRGVTAAHNPVSNCKLASGIARVPQMLNQGLNVALGTDGVSSNNNMDLFEEIKLAAILHNANTLNPQAVSAYDALKMATVNGAKAQGRENECGKIAPGFDADLILLDFQKPHLIPCHNVLSNLAFSAKGSDVILTMVRGKILYDHGKFTFFDLDQTVKELEQYALPLIMGK